MTWARAVKTKLGDSYHVMRDGELTAMCNKFLVLENGSQTDEPGTALNPGTVCGRCQNIEWQKKRNQR